MTLHLLTQYALLTVGVVSDVSYKIDGVAVAGAPFAVTIVGGTFVAGESKVAIVPDQYGCNYTRVEQTPVGSVGNIIYTVNDGPEWVVNVLESWTRSWGGTEHYVCLLSHTIDGYWDIVSSTSGFLGFYTYNTLPTYTVRPVMPVAAEWSGPVSLTIHGIGWDLSSSVKVSTTKEGCSASSLSGNVTVADGQLVATLTIATPDVYYVCLSIDQERTWTVLPVDPSESTNPGVGRFGFIMYDDRFNFTGIYPKFTCSRVIAGVPSTCRLTLQNFFQNLTTSQTPQFAVTYLTDGKGTLICPYPQLVENYNEAGVELLFTFVPLRAGRLGRVRILYNGSPIPIRRVEDDPLGEILEASPGNVTGVEDNALYKFIVEETYMDSVMVGDEMVANPGAEEGLTGWVNQSEWEIASRNPASAWGLVYFAPVAGHKSTLTQTVQIPETGYYRLTTRFYVTVNVSDPGFLGSDTDGVITFTWKAPSGDLTSTSVITHTSSTRYAVTQTWGGTDKPTSTITGTLPMASWESFIDERQLPADITEVVVLLEAEARRGVIVAFDEISLKKINFLTTPDLEKNTLIALYSSTSGSSWESSLNWLSGDPCKDHWQGVSCHYSHVTSITLPYNSMQGVLPDLSGLLWLEELDLSNNGLTGGFGNLSDTVKSVNLAGNHLTWVGKELPQCIVKLDVMGNRLTEVPDSMWGREFLEYVDISRNRVEGGLNASSGLGEGMVASSLKVFLAGGNRLTGDLPVFSEVVYASLHTVDLSGNSINATIPSHWPTSLPSLTTLILSENLLQGTLPYTFHRLPHLSSLTITVRNNLLTGIVPAWVASARRVDIRGNNFACPIPAAPPGVLFGQSYIPSLDTCDTTQ
eukprot:TRINITY_DN5042_c2_g3_i1.p1 TRINITY_DN5042_c2_g3~~TRINITY_DN5042_c2_g3_i1.p1  ORF type:complete len:863 (+),score=163.05 TRINITY_DN5042_c2_g3_i1:62-2650(+)